MSSVALPTSQPPLLSLHDLSLSHQIDGKPFQVLRNIDLDISNGTFVSIVGPSGCGKSSLLRLIVGLDTGFEGTIAFEGAPVRGLGSGRGMAFQDHRLFPWLTVEQNIDLGLDATNPPAEERRKAVREHIALVGLTGFEKAYPAQLSGGMAQRAAIARALVTRPSLLLLDEPLGALDSLNRTHMQNELLKIWRTEKITFLMVTHDVEEAVYLSNEVVVMGSRPGRIRARVPIDLPHLRQRDSAAFVALRKRIVDELE
ncbi:ABC transporter ATP-binding protein [Aureimonas fodinaquatilis]|uniref:ABC transporter ATP-binding protein n=1 Tax=Aureimonas fodinaquatilis TaxID=2565783 RepID=A0A5B0DWZ7_9HYPH|nr:ABC transporter ATP-binding protein [Aureimonas fodinaquatilis]KAA0970888.1 ABC transporter ATP-binding protein [Aureimonas fodinaquatilis]